ncbi:hypothetical protein [Bacillus subtilis]|uniref:hypothetical protein n=1 Tax=Bacillus subtilis TaxID=1423 RepID=UPI001F36E315|nr:hypothetical protein [Bacillus subtilis]UJE03981.1 hypothetical protein HNV25_10335 [Bacillus subtilis]
MNTTEEIRRNILNSLRVIDADSLIFIEARRENLQKQFDNTKHLPRILAVWNNGALPDNYLSLFPFVGGATLAFWWAYYKDRKKLLAVNYLSDLLGRIKK